MKLKNISRRLAAGSFAAAAGLALLAPLNMGGCNVSPEAIGGMIQGGGQMLKSATLNENDENAMAESVAVAVTNRHPLTADDRLNRYVNLVGMTVADASPRPDIRFRFGVIESDQPNAYSSPGSTESFVFITRGALRQMRDESELAGVLAHEVAHVVKRHGFDAAKNAGFWQGASQIAGSANEQASQFVGSADGVAKIITDVGYNQPQETEADAEAVKYLVAAGYDAEGYARFLAKEQGGGGLSTHPNSADRVQRVRAAIRSAGAAGAGKTMQERFAANVTMR